MLKVQVLTQEQKNVQFWQDTFTNVWEGPVEISFQKDFQLGNKFDLMILDFSGLESNARNMLVDLSKKLDKQHFLVVTDKEDANLATEALQSGAMGFLVRPFRRAELLASLDKLHTAPIGQSHIQRAGKIISLLSYKGGTGVSTTTVNLAYALANIYNKKTLVIDIAGFSNHITVLLNIIPKCTLADICKQGNNLDEQYLENAVSKAGKNLAVIGGFLKTSDYNEINSNGLENLVKIASGIYDFILVDTSSHLLDELTMFFTRKAHELLVLTTFDLLAIKDNRFLINMLKELGIMEHRIKPVINRQDWYIGSLEPELAQKQINHPIFYSLPNDWQLCVESTNYGRPILEFAPNSKLATAYKILAGKIVKSDVLEIESEDKHRAVGKSGKSKGILSWF